MVLVLSDADKKDLPPGACPERCVFFKAEEGDAGCCGCFQCWFEHPGSCVKNDRSSSFIKDFSKCDELLVISRNTFGSYSPSVKNVLDRSISYLRPTFRIYRGEMHHKRRCRRPLVFSTVFYGPVSREERASIELLTRANAVNLYAGRRAPRFLAEEEREARP